MPNTIEVKGIKQLNSSLKTFEKDVRLAPTRINREAAKDVAAEARTIAPRRSGRLARSVTAGASGTSAYVKTALIYSGVIHFGWPHHHIKPQPFLYNALDKRRDEVVALYALRIQQLADKVHGI